VPRVTCNNTSQPTPVCRVSPEGLIKCECQPRPLMNPFPKGSSKR
jgi:hypothetical protein